MTLLTGSFVLAWLPPGSLVKVRAVRGIVRPAREVLIVLEETPNSPMAVTFWSELPLPDDIGVGQKLRGSAV